MARCLIEPLSQGGEPCAHVFRQGDQGAYRHQGEITIRPNLTSRNDPRVNAKLPRRFPSAQTLDLDRVTNPPIKLNHLHPPPSAITPKGYLLPEFYSGATGLTGRFNEGFLPRRLHLPRCEVWLGPSLLRLPSPKVSPCAPPASS